MAAPITHIIFAEKLLQNYFNEKDKKEFLIGSLFPDIRYFGVISREKTHFEDIALVELREESSFMAGLKSHSLVDKIREDFIKKSGIYSICPESKLTTFSLKCLEDEILYQKIDHWDEIISYFNTILNEETAILENEKAIKKWHELLQDYFKVKPSEDSVVPFVKDLGFTDEQSDEIYQNIKFMRNKKEINEIIENFYSAFNELVR